jgi:hypothetical protein
MLMIRLMILATGAVAAGRGALAYASATSTLRLTFWTAWAIVWGVALFMVAREPRAPRGWR